MAINKKCAIGAAILTPLVIMLGVALIAAFLWVLIHTPKPPLTIAGIFAIMLVGVYVIILIYVIWQALYDHCVNRKYKSKINKIKE